MFRSDEGNDYSPIEIRSEHRGRAASPLYLPLPATPQPTHGGSDIYWKQILSMLRKHWRFSVPFALVFLTALTTITFLMKDTYEARARIQIEPPPGPETFTLHDTPTPTPNEQDYLQTQIELLKSDTFAVEVIRTLGLDRKFDISEKSKQPQWKDVVVHTLHLDRIFKATARSSIDLALNDFHSRFSVDQVRNSRLVEVSFSSGDPRLAAEVTNTLIHIYVERSHRSRYDDTIQAASWLSGELNDLRQRVEKANQALVNLQNSSGILEFSDNSDGSTRQNPVTQKVAELSRQLTQAQSERIQQEAYLKMIQSGNGDALPQMRDNPILQDLTKRFVETRAQVAYAQAIYGKNNPNLEKLQNQADELEAQLAAERQRVLRQVKTAYEAARAREMLLMQALTEMKGSVDDMNRKMIQYSLLKREAQAASDLYNTLSSRLREAAIAAGLKSTNIRVVDEARIPSKPVKPNRVQIIALGMVFSVLAGIGISFFRESLDDTVRTPDDVKVWTGLHSLAMFPVIDGHRSLTWPSKLLGNGDPKKQEASRLKFFLERPRSPEAEAVRNLQTSIRLLPRAGRNHLRVILLVSPSPNEGKTTVAINLAMALSQQGRTCLVDADLRNPTVAQTFVLPVQQGLADVLTGSASLEKTLHRLPGVANLTILPAGHATPPDPGELVASEAMSEVLQGLREKFDHIVIDSPPIIPFADARWLSSLADGVILVGRYGSTTRQALVLSTEMLGEVDAPLLGVVLNGVDIKSEYYWYGA